MKKRTGKNLVDMSSASSMVFNETAGSNKVMNSGPQMLAKPGDDSVAAYDFSAGTAIGNGVSLWIYNSSGSVAFINFGKTALPAAPTSLATGIPLKPNDWTFLNTGEYNYIRTSAATVGVYMIKDDTTLTESN